MRAASMGSWFTHSTVIRRFEYERVFISDVFWHTHECMARRDNLAHELVAWSFSGTVLSLVYCVYEVLCRLAISLGGYI